MAASTVTPMDKELPSEKAEGGLDVDWLLYKKGMLTDGSTTIFI